MSCHLINISDSLVEFARKENEKAFKEYQKKQGWICPKCGRLMLLGWQVANVIKNQLYKKKIIGKLAYN